jgi:hypothetical protein
MTNKFLGRTLDPLTMTYSHDDGSGGAVPIEVKYEMEMALAANYGLMGNFCAVMAPLWAWEAKQAGSNHVEK